MIRATRYPGVVTDSPQIQLSIYWWPFYLTLAMGAADVAKFPFINTNIRQKVNNFMILLYYFPFISPCQKKISPLRHAWFVELIKRYGIRMQADYYWTA